MAQALELFAFDLVQLTSYAMIDKVELVCDAPISDCVYVSVLKFFPIYRMFSLLSITSGSKIRKRIGNAHLETHLNSGSLSRT